MIADALTKPLTNDRHQMLTRAMDLEAFDYLHSGKVEGIASARCQYKYNERDPNNNKVKIRLPC
jgi:hypothetical protein